VSEVIFLESFPFPPSVNESYQSVKRGFRSTLIATDKLRRFKQDVEFYKHQHFMDLLKCHAKISAWLDEGFVIQAKVYLFLPHDEIFTKGKKAKSKFHKIDGNNRIKATLDAVANCIDIDDSYFFDDGTVKAVQLEGMPKCVIIELSKTKILQAKDLMDRCPQLKVEAFSASR
jgi:Holliday junction resolvase RusA-like endonuclease